VNKLPDNLPDDKKAFVLEQMLSRQVYAKSDELIRCFQGLMTEDYEPSVERMTIHADLPCDFDGFPYYGASYGRYLDGKDKLVTQKRSGNFAGDGRDFQIEISGLPYVGDEEFIQLDYEGTLGRLISEMTYDSWLKAGGWFFYIPTEFILYNEPGMGGDVYLTATRRRIELSSQKKQWWKELTS